MSDIRNMIDELRAFVEERDWDQFHSPENLAKSVAIEAGELLECFQWSGEGDREHIAEEAADVLSYLLQLFDKMGIDPIEAFESKMRKNREKYPVELARGSSVKYDRLLKK